MASCWPARPAPRVKARGLKAHGAIKRPVLVALGLRPDGKKEIIDFHLAQSESAAEWERFLGDLTRRGLIGEGLEMICVDGGSGLLAALPTGAVEEAACLCVVPRGSGRNFRESNNMTRVGCAQPSPLRSALPGRIGQEERRPAA
jgi:hypothetical protein